MLDGRARTLLASLILAPLALVHCGDEASPGGDGGGDSSGPSVGVGADTEELCERVVAAECDFAADCLGIDEDRCLEGSKCSEATDASPDDVEECIAGWEEAECEDTRAPRACDDAVTYPEPEQAGAGGGSGGGDGDGDGDGGEAGDGDGDGGAGGDGGGGPGCTSSHECINDACECTTPGKEGEPCTDVDACELECEVCE